MIRRTILKTPAEYAKEIENYKQLTNNVAVIFKTPEFERQALVQALKLEEEGKTSARELIRTQQETKERPQSLSADDEEYLRLYNTINTLLNDGEDLFNIVAIQSMNKNELEDTKDLLQKIKKQDIGSGNMEKTRYINKSINLINQRLNSKPMSTTKKSVIKPKDLGAVGAEETKSVAVSQSVSLPENIQKIIDSPLYVQQPKKLKDLTDDQLKNVSEELKLYYNILKNSDLDSSVKNKIRNKLDGRKKAIREINSRRTMGLGLTKKSKATKSKSDLGKQEQIYYILSKRAGNNNKLMKKRLKSK